MFLKAVYRVNGFLSPLKIPLRTRKSGVIFPLWLLLPAVAQAHGGGWPGAKRPSRPMAALLGMDG